MRKCLPSIAVALCVSTLAMSALQERVKPKAPREVPVILDAAKSAFAIQQYGACIGELQEAITLVAQKRREQVLGALPAAPTGWEIVPDRNEETQNPYAGALASTVGNVFQREYRQTAGGRARMTVQMTTDSPMVQMFNMWIQNPAMLGDDGEIIKYGAHHAVLRTKSGNQLQLQIMLHGAHLCDVSTREMTEDALFALFNQAAIDRLAAALAK